MEEQFPEQYVIVEAKLTVPGVQSKPLRHVIKATNFGRVKNEGQSMLATTRKSLRGFTPDVPMDVTSEIKQNLPSMGVEADISDDTKLVFVDGQQLHFIFMETYEISQDNSQPTHCEEPISQQMDVSESQSPLSVHQQTPGCAQLSQHSQSDSASQSPATTSRSVNSSSGHSSSSGPTNSSGSHPTNSSSSRSSTTGSINRRSAKNSCPLQYAENPVINNLEDFESNLLRKILSTREHDCRYLLEKYDDGFTWTTPEFKVVKRNLRLWLLWNCKRHHFIDRHKELIPMCKLFRATFPRQKIDYTLFEADFNHVMKTRGEKVTLQGICQNWDGVYVYAILDYAIKHKTESMSNCASVPAVGNIVSCRNVEDIPLESRSETAFLILLFLVPQNGQLKFQPTTLNKLMMIYHDTSMEEIREDIAAKELGGAPVLVKTVLLNEQAEEYFIALDGQFIITGQHHATKAIALLCASFYVFWLEYPRELRAIFRFMEHVMKLETGWPLSVPMLQLLDEIVPTEQSSEASQATPSSSQHLSQSHGSDWPGSRQDEQITTPVDASQSRAAESLSTPANSVEMNPHTPGGMSQGSSSSHSSMGSSVRRSFFVPGTRLETLSQICNRRHVTPASSQLPDSNIVESTNDSDSEGAY